MHKQWTTHRPRDTSKSEKPMKDCIPNLILLQASGDYEVRSCRLILTTAFLWRGNRPQSKDKFKNSRLFQSNHTHCTF